MIRKILIGIAIIITGFLINSYYYDAKYHLSESEIQSMISGTKDIEKAYKYYYIIEKEFGSFEVWGKMNDSKKQEFINKKLNEATWIPMIFIGIGILTFSIPTKSKRSNNDK